MDVMYGNAGSRSREAGARTKQTVEKAHQQVADLVGGARDEVIFTGGAAESNNPALLGVREYGERAGRKHIIRHPGMSV